MDVLDMVHEGADNSPQRPFTCTFRDCEKGFARKSDLVRHERIHTNERPWRCNWPGCPRDFIQRSALVVHMRTHTGERPHKCEYHGCDKAFSDSSSLARHRRIHTGKRPYMCAVRHCLKTFCRKTTLTKHIKKNHPQYAHTPDAVSLASFGPDSTPQLGYTPSIGGDSAPQTPSDQSDDDMANGSYSYFPPQLGASSYPASSKTLDGLGGGYTDSPYSAPEMERSISQSSQAYLTPPSTHETRFRSSRRKAAATQGHYREYNSDDEDEDDDGDNYDPRGAGAGEDDDGDYIEGAEPEISGSGNKYRRGAVSVGSSRISRQLRYPGNQQRQQQQHQQHGSSPARGGNDYSPEQAQRYAAYENQQHFAPPPSRRGPPPAPQYHNQQPSSLSSYSMNPSYTAPIPQYEFDPHSHHHNSPHGGFAAPPLRRASSFSTLEHFSSAGPIQQNFSSHHPHHSHLDSTGAGVGLGLSLGSPFTPELHERRLSEMHNSSLNQGGGGVYADQYDEYTAAGDSASAFVPPSSGGPLSSAASDPLPFPSPSFTFARPQVSLSTGNTPRRGSIGFPNLPHHLTNNNSSSVNSHPAYETYEQEEGGPSSNQWQGTTNFGRPAPNAGFSSMTSRLLDRLDSHENNGGQPSSGARQAMYQTQDDGLTY